MEGSESNGAVVDEAQEGTVWGRLSISDIFIMTQGSIDPKSNKAMRLIVHTVNEWSLFPNTKKFLSECFLLFYLEYITMFLDLSRILLFHQILKILFNCWKDSSSKVPPYDVTHFNCVSKVGVVHFLFTKVFVKYVEFLFKKWTWHIKQDIKRKIITYLGVNGNRYKWPKNGCKG